MSSLFLKYERLRWIFIDEFPTVGVEVLATAEYNIGHNTREENTWRMRTEGETRPWGGMNLCCTGDFWQFRPVNLTAVFDDPYKSHKLSSTDTQPFELVREASGGIRK